MSLSASVLLGSQTPSVELLPRESAGSAGAEAVELAALCGLKLDPWQAYCLEHGLSERKDGLWAAFICAIVVSRQNGKGSILEARELAGLFLLNEHLILHSAHEFKTCYEHFLRITTLIESTPDLEKRVGKIRRGVGEQAIELRNGNRLRFIARSSGSGRGMSAPCVVLDEFMFATEAMVGAVMPTLSAQVNPQLWMTSSAPLAASEPLHRIRAAAKAGEGDRLFYAEWGNEDGVDLEDEEAVARANPALGRRIFMDFVAAEREAMSPTEFARERLGVPEAPASDGDSPVSLDRWLELTDAKTPPKDDETVRLALDAPPDRQSATFASAHLRDDGLIFVQVRYHCRPTQPARGEEPADQPLKDRVIDMALKLTKGHNTSLILPPSSPARAWKADLVAAGVSLDEMTPAEYAEACGRITNAVDDGALRHRGQPEMNNAVAGLAVRTSGDVDAWSRRNSSANIAPFVAATCALVRVPDHVQSTGLFLAVT
jgi:phage terminase large subunit-like protein